jgi:hypothetical protein
MVWKRDTEWPHTDTLEAQAQKLEGGGDSTMGIADFSIRKIGVRKMEKSGLNQSLTYMHFLPQIARDFFFIFPSSTQ